MNIRHTSRHRWFMRSRNSRRVLLIIALLALLVAGSSYRSFYLRKSAVTSGLEALRAAYDGRRPLQARISGLAYAPFISRRGESDDFDPVNRDLAERLLREAVAEKPTSSARQALGQFYLMSGSPAKAMVQFEEALKQDSNNASLHNDFGVALMETSHRSPAIDSDETLLYAAKALEEFETAVKLDSGNVEALHNRALVLDQLKLPQQRDQAWQDYLARETNRDWSAEAKRTIQNLSQANSPSLSRTQVLESFLAATLASDDERSWRELTRNKEMISEKFIPQELAYSLLSASLSKNADEARKLSNALRYAGKLELEKAGDPYVSEIAAFYSRASIEQQKLLNEAHVLLRSSYAECRKSNCDYAQFDESRKLFLRAGDVWEAKICEYWMAYCLSPKDIPESTKLLTSVAKFAKEKHYYWLQVQALSWIADNHTRQREFSKSLENYDNALSIATRINDVYSQQKILSQAGNDYMLLGQSERALQYDWRALQLIDIGSTSVRQMWRTYLYTARTLAALGLYEAATQYGAAMLYRAVNDPGMSHYSYRYLTQINAGKKNLAEAFRLASESMRFADSLKDPLTPRTESLVMLGHLQRQSGAIDEAVKSYSEAIDNYNKMKRSIYKYDALKGRLLCYAALKDNANFEAQLSIVLDEFEIQRTAIFEEQNGNVFFDREQSVYDFAIDHELGKHDDLSALNYSELSRARSLLKALTEEKAETPSSPLHADELKRRLPANLQVLQYAVLEDRLVVWLITSDGIRAKTKDIRADELRSQVTDYVRGISSGPGKADKLRAVSQRLYDTLIGPFREELDPGRVLCIIPDKSLSYVPFDALISPVSQRYLLSEFSLLSSPSLNVLVRETAAAKDRASASADETLLSIGNPSFDRLRYPALDDLPAAAREATGIAGNYAKSYPPLIGPAAVKQTIEKQLPTADVVHFAGHYIPNQAEPLLSKLILARQKGSDNSDLTLGELVNIKLPRTRLVVLSACETSGEHYYNGEGLTGIAQTFLRTGIPIVIASQWSVESESTAQLMLKFHRYRKIPGVSSIAALRKAQLELLEDPHGFYSDPYYWAAFTPVGGYADF